MDYEEKKRRETIRVIIAEIGMVFAVIAIVIVATLAAMGFFISSDGKIEQNGLIQLHSLPTGATVELDGATLFSRTNLSRTMAAGEHRIRLSRENYDTWEKTIRMRPGILMRLYYPRLFLQARTAETVLKLGAVRTPSGVSDAGAAGALVEAEEVLAGVEPDFEFFKSSPSRNYAAYMREGETKLRILNLRGDEVKEVVVEVSAILPGVAASGASSGASAQGSGASAKPATAQGGSDAAGTPLKAGGESAAEFLGEILEVRWSGNDEKILLKVKYAEGGPDWILVNLRDVKQSLNLTKAFGMKFEKVEMIDDSASQLFVLENHNLRKIDVSQASISKVLIGAVADFTNNGNKVAYVAEKNKGVGVYRDGEAAGTILEKLDGEAAVKVLLARYYDEDYICYYVGDELTIRYGEMPSYREEGAEIALKTLLKNEDLPGVPTAVELSPNGDYLRATVAGDYVVTELERGESHEEYGLAEGERLDWLDSHMLYQVKGGRILVRDYDNTNLRDLSLSVSEGAARKVATDWVMINANDQWMYYLSFKGESVELVREKIR